MRPWPAVAAALLPATAVAHAPLAGAGGFYAGLVHPLTDLTALLALAALLLLIGRSQRQLGVWAALAAAAATLAGGVAAVRGLVTAPLPALLAGSVMVTGLVVAADWRLPAALLLSLSAVSGAALGLAQGGELPGIAAAAGAALAVALLLLYGAGPVGLLHAPWARIGVRVVGSWLVAIEAMMLGLALR